MKKKEIERTHNSRQKRELKHSMNLQYLRRHFHKGENIINAIIAYKRNKEKNLHLKIVLAMKSI